MEMNIESKMSWQVKQYQDGTIGYELNETGENFGTIVVPTGGGKSGIIIRDILYHVDNSLNDKFIFNLSCPLLNLCSQLSNDLTIGTLKHTHEDKWKNGEFLILVNSSSDISKYKQYADEYVKIEKFDEMNNALKKNSNVRFVIIISCHESLENFATKIKELKQNWIIANYFDEAHTLVKNMERRDDVYINKYDELDFNEQTKYDTLEILLNNSDYSYAFSATPHKMITKLINDKLYNKEYDENEEVHYIYSKTARELINEGSIVDVRPRFIIDEDKPLDANDAIKFMKECIRDNPHISHKVLITCDDSNHLKLLQDALEKRGYKDKVFSTCSKHGISMPNNSNYHNENKDSDGNFDGISPQDFIDGIDNCNEHCFVLHIKQLTAGIDIKTLTDCIICNNGTKIQDGVKTKYIQIIGRILRVLKGERPEDLKKNGKTLKDRKKKYGTVLFRFKRGEITNDIIRQVSALLINYYGLKDVLVFNQDKIGTDYGNTGQKNPNRDTKVKLGGGVDLPPEITNLYLESQDMLINIEKYMKDIVKPTMDKLEKCGLIRKGNGQEIRRTRDEIMKHFSLGRFNKENEDKDHEYPVRDIITYDELTDAITRFFKKYYPKKQTV